MARTGKSERGAAEGPDTPNLTEPVLADTPADPAAIETETVTLREPADAPEPRVASHREPSRAAPAPTKAAPARRGGFFPMLTGGAVAAGLGFALAQYGVPEGWPTPAAPSAEEAALAETVKAQAADIASLRGEIEAMRAKASEQPAVADAVSALSAGLDQAKADIGSAVNQITALSDTVGGFDGRIGTLEKRPVAGGAASDTAVAAFEQELAALRAEIEAGQASGATQAEDITKAAAEAEARIAAAEAEALRVQQESEAAARLATARAAVSHLQAALESGSGIEAAIAGVTGAGLDLPAVISAEVPTLAALRESFPDAARLALSASLRATAGDTTMDKFTAFLRSQTGARSLSPKEGADPDAVLSRAEAALAAGDLPQVLAEIATLPAEGQAEMADWRALAEGRIAATDAVAALSAATTGN